VVKKKNCSNLHPHQERSIEEAYYNKVKGKFLPLTSVKAEIGIRELQLYPM